MALKIKKQLKGFTLMELMVVLIFGVILYQLMLMFGTTSLSIQEMDRTTQTARSELALARSRAMSGKGGSSWGVAFATSSIIQFQGSSYATRNAIYDLSSPLTASIAVTGTREYVFTAPFGDPVQAGTTTFMFGGRTRSVVVNLYGMIELK